jgi:hypothetical protein
MEKNKIRTEEKIQIRTYSIRERRRGRQMKESDHVGLKRRK